MVSFCYFENSFQADNLEVYLIRLYVWHASTKFQMMISLHLQLPPNLGQFEPCVFELTLLRTWQIACHRSQDSSMLEQNHMGLNKSFRPCWVVSNFKPLFICDLEKSLCLYVKFTCHSPVTGVKQSFKLTVSVKFWFHKFISIMFRKVEKLMIFIKV